MNLTKIAWTFFALGVLAIIIAPWLSHSSVAACVAGGGTTLVITAVIVGVVNVINDDEHQGGA